MVAMDVSVRLGRVYWIGFQRPFDRINGLLNPQV
jgi:hypothetical protein